MGLLKDLAAALEMPEDDIARIVMSAPRRYKVFTIPKRSGSDRRIIAQPARKLKAIQRYVLATKLSGLPVHPMATAYQAGKNIADNAAPHAKKRVILKLDFKDFFNSITPGDLQAVINKADLDTVARADRGYLNYIFFWLHPLEGRLCLSIGAPSSPFIFNAVMAPLDRQIQAIAQECSTLCTRYADDITLSGNSIENLLKAEQRIKTVIFNSRQPRLTFNDEKRGLYTTAGRRIVTGLVLTPDGKVSLGRDRKRRISAALHHISTGRNVTLEHRQQTRGWLAYANSVEPNFVVAMSVKYPHAFRAVLGMPFKGQSGFPELLGLL
jgi:RNA-directed DNA polymerase